VGVPRKGAGRCLLRIANHARAFYKPKGSPTKAESDRRYNRTKRDPESVRFYHSTPWLRLRALQLSDHPECQDCHEKRDDLVEAKHVHHVKPIRTHPELRLDQTNLRSLCVGCHNHVDRAKDDASDA
jgi:5-methylcytosine-specific restriction endonuclease McrA